MSNKPAKKSDNPIKNLPRNLKKVAENYRKRTDYPTLKQVCEEEGVNYNSARTQIVNYSQKHSDFWQLVADARKIHNAYRISKLDDVVFNGALDNTSSLDTQAAKLFYQRMGALDTGSGGDRTQVNVNVLTVASPISPEQPVDIQVERQRIEDEDE